MRVFHLLVAIMLTAAAPVAAEEAKHTAPAQQERGDPFTTPIVPLADPDPAKEAAKPDPLPVLEMVVGDMKIVRLGEIPSTTITTFPGIVSVGIEPPDMLFIFAEAPGETQLIVADSNYGELFAQTILVMEKP